MPKRRVMKKIDKCCTYDLGYVRQDLYACNYCTEQAGGSQFGFCRACREACHGDHADQVIELYTKRNFRCDCGNQRAKNQCRLEKEKEAENIGNEQCYGHNFEGRYCRCDTEYDIHLAMAQCAMCEDWFHEKCYKLDRNGGKDTPYEFEYELICKDCVKILPLLAEYYEYYGVWTDKKFPVQKKSEDCIRPKKVRPSTKPGTVDYMWAPGFRLFLCRCDACMDIYQEAKVLYISNRHDLLNTYTEADDSDLLKGPEGDADIVHELLNESEESSSSKSVDTPRTSKHATHKRGRSVGKTPKNTPRSEAKKRKDTVEVATDPFRALSSRQRMEEFVREAIRTNGASMNRDSLLQFRKDLNMAGLENLNQSHRLQPQLMTDEH